MNERLADLTEADVLEIARHDPRVKLMERLYGDPLAAKDIQAHTKRLFPQARIPEVDLPAETRKAIEPDLRAIKDLAAELETDRKSRRHQSFRGQLVDAGADEADLDKIETFMVDNELGPKSVKLAVEKFYESQELAEPRGSDLTWTMPEDDYIKQLLAAGPGDDLDLIATRQAEKVFSDINAASSRARRRATV